MIQQGMEEIQATIERACEQFQNPHHQREAEQVLLQFRQSSGSLPSCQHILERSHSAEARFHAACTLRDSIVREWASFSQEQTLQLRSYLLQYCIHHAGSQQLAAVRAICLESAAIIVKRGWTEAGEEDKARFFRELQSLCASGAASPGTQQVCLQLLEALVTEFSLVTASALGLSWEVHDTCRCQMETGYLPGLFNLGLQLAVAAAPAAAAGDADAGATLSAAIGLMGAILNWDFKGSATLTSAMAGGAQQAQSISRNITDTTTVKPGPSWGPLLLSASATDWLLQLLPALRGPRMETPLAVRARQLLVSFCSISGDIFPKPSHGPAVAPHPPSSSRAAAPGAGPRGEVSVAVRDHVTRMLQGLLLWVWPPSEAVARALHGSEGEVVDAARALATLCLVHKPGVLDAAGRQLVEQGSGGAGAAAAAGSGGSSPPQVFQVLEGLTRSCMEAGGVSPSSATEPWLPDVTELLLDCWSGLLQPQCGYSMAAVPPPQLALECGARTFGSLVTAALVDAAAGAHEEGEADDLAGVVSRSEWLSRAAALARAQPELSFPALAEAMVARQGQLLEVAAAGGDPGELLEQLEWLVRMAAHSLADEGGGEVPLVPEWVLLSVEHSPAGVAAVEKLSHAVLGVCSLSLQQGPGKGPPLVASPRLMEACCWAAARWVDTYLYPEEDAQLPPQLQVVLGTPPGGAEGEGTPGWAILELLVGCSTRWLSIYPGEVELHGQVCYYLLPALVRRRAVCARLLQLPSWQQLLAAFAQGEALLAQQLGQKQQRALAKSLVAAAVGCGDQEGVVEQYMQQLLGRTVHEVEGLAGHQQLQALVQRADVQLKVCCLLEVLRGAACANLPCSQQPVLGLLLRLLQPLLLLHTAFKHQAPVVALLLKLADDIVAHQLDLVSYQQLQQVLHWVLQLLQQYRDSQLWQVSLQTAKTLQAEKQADQCRDLRAVLRLLTHLTELDVTDVAPPAAAANGVALVAANGGHAAGGPPGGAGADSDGGLVPEVTRLVLLGLHIVLPLLTAELLKFPKLASLYYGLLGQLLEGHTGAVASLEAGQFNALMSSLDWGLNGADTETTRCCLEGLAGLARWQYHRSQQGAPGLNVHTPAGGTSAVGHFQELLLRRLLLEEAPGPLVDLSADALLPLLLAEPGRYAALSQGLVAAAAERGDGRAVAVVHGSLGQLGEWLGKHVAAAQDLGDPGAVLSRRSLTDFRQRLSQMVADVRGLIRVR